MAAAMGEGLPPQLSTGSYELFEDPEQSPQIQELRRQIAQIREMEQQQLAEIKRLKESMALRKSENALRDAVVQPASYTPEIIEQPRISLSKPEIIQAPVVFETVVQPPVVVQLPQVRSVQQMPVPDSPAPAPPVTAPSPVVPTLVNAPAPLQRTGPQEGSQVLSPRAQGSGIFGRKKTKAAAMGPPQSVEMKVLNASWDSGSSKSKKTNKVYTIQVSINGIVWKVIRNDENLAELSKRMGKLKAEGIAVPPITKKVVKRDQQKELATALETYLNQLNLQLVFGPKATKAKLAYMKFFGPFGPGDEGLGNFQGNVADQESWFMWKLGLNA